MKKRFVILFGILFAFTLFFLYSINSQITGSTVTGDAVTGEITSAGASLSINLIGPPILILDSPKNDTYLIDENLDLKFTARSADLIWYNLDNGANTTITGNTTFNTTNPVHALYLYANNTHGLTSESVTFSVNTSKLFINYSNYKEQGLSTDFNKSGFEELQNLSGIIFEIPEYGKISFNEPINVTNDENSGDNFVDINSYVNISFNRTEINITALPNFNKSATISFYNLTFSNPRILKDGEICPSSICSIMNYSGGILIFNVTSFSIYSAEETPTSTPIISGGGAGQKKESFSVNTEEIILKLKQGETTKREIIILNDGNEKLSFSLEATPEITKFIKIDKINFELESGKAEIITLDFLVKEDTPPNFYLGKLVIKADGVEEEILIGVEVTTRRPLFDIDINLLEKFQNIMPGEEIYYKIEIFNLGDVKRQVDVSIEHRLLDVNGNIILSEHQSIAIMSKIEYIKEIKIPENLPYGKNIIYVKATYNGETASASVWFNVGKRSLIPKNILLIIAFILAIGIILIALIIIVKKIRARLGYNFKKSPPIFKRYRSRYF